MKPLSSPNRRRRTRLIALAGAIALYAITGFFILPPILRSQATKQLSEALHRPVAIDKVALNPFTLSMTVRGFTVTDHDGAELAGFDDVYANFQLSSIFRRMWYFREVRIERPRGRLVVAADGTLNIADLAAEAPAEDLPAEPAATPRFLIESLEVSTGNLHFIDKSRATNFETLVGPVTVTLQKFGTGSGDAGNIVLQGNTESGERFAFDGLLHVNDLSLSGHFTMTGVHAPKYDPFHHTMTLFEVAGGKISFDVRFVVNAKGGLTWKIDPADFAIEDLHIRARGETEDAIYLPALLVSGIRVDSATRTASVARVALEAFPAGTAPAWSVQGSDSAAAANGATTIRLTRLADGSIDLATLLTPRLGSLPVGDLNAPAAAPWTATIAEFSIQDSRIELNDTSNTQPVRLLLDDLDMIARNLSSDPAAEILFETSLRWQEQGTLRAHGTATRAPLHAKVEFEAADLLLAALDPYLEPFAAVRLADGVARASGTITVSKDLSAAEPSLAFEGSAGLDRLVVKTADGETPLMSLGSLDLREVRFKSPPVTLDIAEVAVGSPAVSAIIAADGTVNLTTVMKAGDAPAAVDAGAEAPAVEPTPTDATPAAPRPVITIGRVVIEDGRADVTDRSMEKEFTTSLRDFGGTISGLSSEELARADVDLKGTLDGTAPFEVSGKVNPLSEDAFTDLRVDFRGIGLPAFTPYSGRYVGYTIDRGRLTLDLTYRLSSRVLEAENKLVFDEFYLGETVESPDAMNLPLKLALGLLRDRSGKIDIDLPIRGNLDDPDFKYGGLVWKAIGNLIAKAATSPFSLLGKLIPGGGDPETLSYVEFAPGAAEIDTASTEKLLTLAGVLYDRPALVLEIITAPAPELDAPPLRTARFEAMLTARKASKLAAAGPSAADSAPATPVVGERETLIREAFAAAFPSETGTAVAETPEEEKPGFVVRTFRRVFGGNEEAEPAPPAAAQPAEVATGPSIEEMEARLLAQIEITPAELEALAAGRANAVRERLLATEKVEAERLVIAAAAESAAPAGTPRVTFSLK
ncbi:MAG TPA: DUF748 domain-containing protein [Opitutaceae bacterium]|nr:DUF748 domain-containing protein [Opitutaceae bacterium]